jgi:hypothetical protein
MRGKTGSLTYNKNIIFVRNREIAESGKRKAESGKLVDV